MNEDALKRQIYAELAKMVSDAQREADHPMAFHQDPMTHLRKLLWDRSRDENTVTLEEIDIRGVDKKGRRDGFQVLRPGDTCLAMIGGQMHLGTFSEQWYGLSFGLNHQWDPPFSPNPKEHNCSMWQRVWLLRGHREAAAALENDYAVRQRAMSAENMCQINGERVTLDTPLRAFKYAPDYSGIGKEDE